MSYISDVLLVTMVIALFFKVRRLSSRKIFNTEINRHKIELEKIHNEAKKSQADTSEEIKSLERNIFNINQEARRILDECNANNAQTKSYLGKAEDYKKYYQEFSALYERAQELNETLEIKIERSEESIAVLDSKRSEYEVNEEAYNDFYKEAKEKTGRLKMQLDENLKMNKENFAELLEIMQQEKNTLLQMFQESLHENYTQENSRLQEEFSKEIDTLFSKYRKEIEENTKDTQQYRKDIDEQILSFHSLVTEETTRLKQFRVKSEDDLSKVVHRQSHIIQQNLKVKEGELQEKYNLFHQKYLNKVKAMMQKVENVGHTVEGIKKNYQKEIAEQKIFFDGVKNFSREEVEILRKNIGERNKEMKILIQKIHSLEDEVSQNFNIEADKRQEMLGKLWEDKKKELQEKFNTQYQISNDYLKGIANEFEIYSQEMKDKVEQKLQSLKEEHIQASAVFFESSRKELERTDLKNKEKIAKLNKNIAVLYTSYQNKIKNIDADHISMLKNYREKIQNLKNEQEQVQEEYKADIEVLYAEHRSGLDKLNKDYQNTLQDFQLSMEDIRTNLQHRKRDFQSQQDLIAREHETLIAQNHAGLEEAREKQKEERQKYQNELEKVRDELKTEQEQVLEKHKIKVETLYAEQQGSLNKLQNDYRSSLHEYQNSIDKIVGEYQKLQKNFQGQQEVINKEQDLLLKENYAELEEIRNKQNEETMKYMNELSKIKNTASEEQKLALEEHRASILALKTEHHNNLGILNKKYQKSAQEHLLSIELIKNNQEKQRDDFQDQWRSLDKDYKVLIKQNHEELSKIKEKQKEEGEHYLNELVKFRDEFKNDKDKKFEKFFANIKSKHEVEIQNLMSSYQNKLGELEKQRVLYRHTTNENIASFETKLERLKEKLEKNEENFETILSNLQNRHTQYMKHLDGDRAMYDKLSTLYDKLEGKSEDVSQTLKEIGVKYKNSQAMLKTLEQIKKDMQLAFSQHKSVKNKLKEFKPIMREQEKFKKQLNEIEDKSVKNAEILSQLEGQKNKMADLQSEINALLENQRELFELQETLEKKATEYKDIQKNFDGMNAKIHDIEGKTFKIKKEYTTFMEKLKNVKSEYSEIDAMSKSLEEIRKTQPNLAAQLKELEKQRDAFYSIEKNMLNFNDKLHKKMQLLALGLNQKSSRSIIGAQKNSDEMTREDKKTVILELYKEHKWTPEQIAQKLDETRDFVEMVLDNVTVE